MEFTVFDTVQSLLVDKCMRPTRIVDVCDGRNDVFLDNPEAKTIYLIGHTKTARGKPGAKNYRVKYTRTHAKMSNAVIDEWGKKVKRFVKTTTENGVNVTYAMTALFYVYDCDDVNEKMLKSIERRKILLVDDNIVIDKSHAISAHAPFLEQFAKTNSSKLLKESARANLVNESPVIYRTHQIYTIVATQFVIQQWAEDGGEDALNIVWGHVARSGKTYMMRGLIGELLKGNDAELRILTITTVPQETIMQYISVMQGLMGSHQVDIVTDKAEIDTHRKSKRAVFIFSKQLLTHRNNWDVFIENVNLLMLDEAHFGGMTEIGLDLINAYGAIPRVFVTATFSPAIDAIEYDLTVNWDLEDMVLLRAGAIDRLKEKHLGFQEAFNSAMKYYEGNNITQEMYKQLNRLPYPKLYVIGYELDGGIDAKKAFKTSRGKFVNEEYVATTLTTILAKTIPELDSYNSDIGQRPIYNKDCPSEIMCFIPSKQIRDLSEAISGIVADMDAPITICECNTLDENKVNVADKIDEALVEAGRTKDMAVLVIAGRQAHLGITIERCDVVIMFNVSDSFEYMFQSMFRCMTEGENKKTGYVIDVNINRSLAFVKAYSEMCASANKPEDFEAPIPDAISSMLMTHAIGWCAHNELQNLNNPEAMVCSAIDRIETIEKETEDSKLAKALQTMTIISE